MNPDIRGGLKDVLLGALYGALISGTCTFNVLMLILFARFDRSFESSPAQLWFEGRWSIFGDSQSVWILAGGALSGGLVGLVLGKRIGRRQLRGGPGLVIGCSAVAVIVFVLVVVQRFVPVFNVTQPRVGGALAVFGAALAAIIGGIFGLIIVLLRCPLGPPLTRPDSARDSDTAPKKVTPAQSDHIATNPGQVFHRSTGERDA
jgi:hypothetical protein